MKVVTLIENTTSNAGFACEHGLSLYIESGEHRILFDFGQSAVFAENAQKLGVDLEQVDIAVLSHGHYDHGGGIKKFLDCNSIAPIYVSDMAFVSHYNASGKYIGLDQALLECDRITFMNDKQEVAPGICLISSVKQETIVPIDSAGLTVLEQGILIPEEFRHEQYLLIEENGKRICISGCSHKGILNIVHWFQPNVLIGGFHFMKLDPQSPVLEETAKELLKYPTTYYTGHCTGQAQFDRLKSIMGNRLNEIKTGTIINL